MRIINIVEINENAVLGVKSYPIEEDQLSQEIVEKAEEDFIKCCRENGAGSAEGAYRDEILLDDGIFMNGTYSVCLTWSDVIL